jgi:DNA-binding transcriptional regulator YiaG
MPRTGTDVIASKAAVMIGTELKRIRHSLAITMDGLARWMGVTKGAISLWERDKREIPGPVALLMRMLEASGGNIFSEEIDSRIKPALRRRDTRMEEKRAGRR